MSAIWIKPQSAALVLAPMEGVMDAPMRAFFTERKGIDFCVSEFLRVSHQVIPAQVFLRDVPELHSHCQTQSSTPVQIQLLGGNEEMMALSAIQAVNLGASAIDINFGCPSKQVNKNDGGASLLRSPDRIYSVVKAVRDVLPSTIPVSAKLRLGWENLDDIFENAERAAQAGANWITIHARTKVQGYAPPVSWKHIGRVKKMIDIPIVANGDIWTFENFLQCQEETGSEHFMLGRGILANPSLVQRIAAHLNLLSRPSAEETLSPDQPSYWLPLLHRFIEINQDYTTHIPYIVRRMKQWIRFAHLQSALPWFEAIKRTETVEEFLLALKTFK